MVPDMGLDMLHHYFRRFALADENAPLFARHYMRREFFAYAASSRGAIAQTSICAASSRAHFLARMRAATCLRSALNHGHAAAVRRTRQQCGRPTAASPATDDATTSMLATVVTFDVSARRRVSTTRAEEVARLRRGSRSYRSLRGGA